MQSKFGDVGIRYKSPKSLMYVLLWLSIPELLPDPLGFVPRISQAGHPLAALTTRPRLYETQGVLQDAEASPTITHPGEQALLDVIDLPDKRPQMSAEDVSHQSWITGDLQLGKARICQERLKAHNRPARHAAASCNSRTGSESVPARP